MTDFRKELDAVYMFVLGRLADEGGFQRYNQLINDDILNLADVQHILMLSTERKNQDEPDEIPEDFVHFKRVENLIEMLEDGIHIWAGVRDPRYVLAHCRGRIYRMFGLYPDQMKDIADAYERMMYAGEILKRDLRMPHKEFSSRSSVDKTRLKKFREWMDALNKTVEGWREAIKDEPGAGVQYDSISGWCRYMNSRATATELLNCNKKNGEIQ